MSNRRYPTTTDLIKALKSGDEQHIQAAEMLETVIKNREITREAHLSSKYPTTTAYTTPTKFAQCIDSIFSNTYDKIAKYHNVEVSRENITVDMFLKWLNKEGNNYSESIGFNDAFTTKERTENAVSINTSNCTVGHTGTV